MDKYREEIKAQLAFFHDRGKILFAVLTCERLYPNYVAFQKITGWGNQDTLQEGIALIRQYLIKEDLFELEEIQSIIEQIDKITPNTEHFPGVTTSFALDACTSVFSTLNFIIDKNSEHILDVATYARDTVDMYIQEKYDLNANYLGIEEKIEFDFFMISEKKWQRDLLKKLAFIELKTITDKMIEGLRGANPRIDLRIFLPLQ
jgi:uncharacterized protein